MWFDKVVKTLLNSPFQRVLRDHLLQLTYSGTKTGKLYTIPVNYYPVEDGVIVFSPHQHFWWRNLVGGKPVTVKIDHKELTGTATVVDKTTPIATYFEELLIAKPHLARYFDIGLADSGHPNPEDITKAATQWVVVHIELAANEGNRMIAA